MDRFRQDWNQRTVGIPGAFDRNFWRSSASTTRECQEIGCVQSTREGKPFCLEHVKNHPYVRELLNIVAVRKAEDDRVRVQGARAVNPLGLTARELVLHLTMHGARTVERLARDLQMDAQAVEGYATALSSLGVVKLGRTNRGSIIVQLKELSAN